MVFWKKENQKKYQQKDFKTKHYEGNTDSTVMLTNVS